MNSLVGPAHIYPDLLIDYETNMDFRIDQLNVKKF